MRFEKYIKFRNCLLALAMTCSAAIPGWSEKWHVFDSTTGLTNESVYSLTETTDGRLWGGTPEGLFSFDGNVWEEVAIDGHFKLSVPRVEASSDGALWVEVSPPDRWLTGHDRAGYALVRVQGDTWTWMPTEFGDDPYVIIDHAEAANGDMWITYDVWTPGVNRLIDGRIAVYRDGALEQIDTGAIPGIEGKWFYGIIPRSDGGVWIYAKKPGLDFNPGDEPLDWLLSYDGDTWSNTPIADVMPWMVTSVPGKYSDLAMISGGREVPDGGFLFEIQKHEFVFAWMDGLVYHDPQQDLWHRMVTSVVEEPSGRVIGALEIDSVDPTNVTNRLTDYIYVNSDEFWFSTNQYIARVVGSDTTRFTTADGLAENSCELMMATSDGSIWAGHRYQGTLSRFHNGTWRTYSAADGLTGAQLTTLFETTDGFFIVGSTKGLAMLVPSPEAVMVSNGDLAIKVIGEDSSGHVWSFDQLHVYKHTASETVIFDSATSFSGTDIVEGLITNSGNIWISNSSELYRWSGDAWHQYGSNNGLDILSISSWSQTAQGDFLVTGAGGNGIFIYDPVSDEFTPWSGMPRELPSNSLNSMARDGAGNRYFATDEGLALLSDGVWSNYTSDDGLADNVVKDVLVDREGNVWGATAMGVSRYDGNSWQTFRGDGDLIDRDANRIALGPDGDLWFATQQGLSRYLSGVWTSFDSNDGLADSAINDVAVTADGTVWAATNEGLNRYTDGTWKTYTTIDGMVHNRVTSLAVESDGSVWVGTSDGVSRLEGEVWSSWTSEDGLLSEEVLSISPGLDNSMWVTTNRLGGVHRITNDDQIQSIAVGEYEQIYERYGLDCENIPVADPIPADHGDRAVLIPDPYTCYNAMTRRVYEESGMGIWFITDKSGALFQETSGSWQHMFKSDRINAFYVDPDQDLWLSSTVAGVHFVQRFEPDSRMLYTCGLDLSLGVVSRFYRQDSDGSVWLVHDYLDNHRTPGRRLSHWSNNSWQVFDLSERLDAKLEGKYLDYLVTFNAGYNFLTASFDFVESDENPLRIFDNQHHHSALEFDGSTWVQPLALESSNFDFNKQNSIVFGSNTAAWHATAAGLFRISEEGVIQVKSDDGLFSGEIRDLFMQKNNVLWASVGPTQGRRAIYKIDLNNPPPAYTLFTDSIDEKIGSNSQYFRVRTGEFGTTEVRPFTYALVPYGSEVDPFDWTPLVRDDLIRLTGLENGQWDLHVRAMGSYGQFDPTPALASFTVDVTPPTAIINTPSTGDIIGNRVAVVGSAFDQSPLEDFTQYTLEYTEGTIAEIQDDTEWIPIASLIPDEVVNDTLGIWDVAPLSGNYLLRVQASDNLDHHSEYVVPILVDNTPPLVELDTVYTDSTYAGTIAIRGTISDEYPAEYHVGYRRLSAGDDEVYPIYTGSVEEISDNQLVVWDSGDETGAIQLVVTAFDQAGNSSDPAEIVIRFDNSSALPHAEITFPQPETVLSGVVEVSGRLADSRFSHYRLEIFDPQLVPDQVEGLNSVQSGEFTLVNFDTREWANGKYSFSLIAFNKEGYASYSNVPFTIDNTPPFAQMEYPVDADTLRGWVEVKAEVSDEHLSSYRLSYGPGLNPPESEMTLLDSGSESIVEHSVAWNTLALHGQYTLVLAGVDAAGLSSARRRSVWIENPPISASEGGSREFDAIRIFVPPGSPSEDIALGVRTYDADPTLDPGSEDLRMAGHPFEIMSAPATIDLRRPATLRVPYDHTAATEKLALFRLSSDQNWQRIGGTLNQGENTISTAIDSFGTFVLFEDHREYGSSTGTLSKLQCQPRMISPRGGWTEQAQISFHLADRAPVSVMVYNMAGQRKKTLLEATLNTGVHSIEWSGRDHNENLVEDGMYIVVAKTPGTAVKQVIGVVNGGK